MYPKGEATDTFTRLASLEETYSFKLFSST